MVVFFDKEQPKILRNGKGSQHGANLVSRGRTVGPPPERMTFHVMRPVRRDASHASLGTDGQTI